MLEPERTLVLVKHAMPEIEASVPPNRWPLSEEGRRDSVVLAERLREYAPEAIVSSEEPKAAETAEIVAARLGVEQVSHPGLHEHDRTGAPFGTNETALQTLDRFAGAVRDVLEQHHESGLVVVAHGTVISLFVARHNGVEAHGLWRKLGLPSFCVLSLPRFDLRDMVHDIHA